MGLTGGRWGRDGTGWAGTPGRYAGLGLHRQTSAVVGWPDILHTEYVIFFNESYCIHSYQLACVVLTVAGLARAGLVC